MPRPTRDHSTCGFKAIYRGPHKQGMKFYCPQCKVVFFAKHKPRGGRHWEGWMAQANRAMITKQLK